MKYIEAPNSYILSTSSVFLAGGITGCPDWQQEIRQLLSDTDLVLLNPRRADFPINDPDAAHDQITWEYIALRDAESILFWFPCVTICPIVLYELGAWSMTDKPIFIGVHPEYTRKQDVMIQTSLVRPEIKVVSTLADLADQVKLFDIQEKTMAHDRATHATREELLGEIMALMTEINPYAKFCVTEKAIIKLHPEGLDIKSDGVEINPDAELIRMKIWAAKVRKTADLIHDVACAWEIMKIPRELNKTHMQKHDKCHDEL